MKTFNFFKFQLIFIIISIALVSITFVFIGVKGFKYGTDFRGGVEVTVAIERSGQNAEDIRVLLAEQSLTVDVQQIVTRDNTFIIRFGVLEEEELLEAYSEDASNEEVVSLVADGRTTPVGRLRLALGNSFAESEFTILQSRIVGSVLSSENRRNAFLTSFFVILLIVGYLTMRFRLPFAVAAIVAVLHDVSIILGFVLFAEVELTILTIVAILTTFGYSVNDTIILFDRIREEEKTYFSGDYKQMVNLSVNRVIGRTIITSLTTMVVVFSLYISTTGDYKSFSLTLLVGLVSGTYSSIYIAPTFIFFWNKYISSLVYVK